MKLLKDEKIKDSQLQQRFSVFFLFVCFRFFFQRAGETWVASFRLSEQREVFPAGLEPATFRVLKRM